MRLKTFYAKNENVISALYEENNGRAEFVVSPFGAGDNSISLWKNVLRYSVPCNLVEFQKATSELDVKVSACKCRV